MPIALTAYRVFIASPGGLAEERAAFREALRAYNDEEAIGRGALFLPIGWEDVLGGVGRPQSRINEDIEVCDHFVLLLWDRWGSSPDATPGPNTSATEEEYNLAVRCLAPAGSIRTMVMMFKAVPPKQLADPGPQLQRVLDFKKTIEEQKQHFFETFDTIEGFRQRLRRHFGEWMRAHAGPALQHSHVRGPLDLQTPSSLLQPAQSLPPADDAIRSAIALADNGKLAEAELAFARLLVAAPTAPLLVYYARFLIRVGRMDRASLILDQAESILTDAPDELSLASVYTTRGDLLEIRGGAENAERMYRQAIDIFEAAGRAETVADVSIRLAVLLRNRGDFDAAEGMLRRSLAISVPLNRRETMAAAYLYLGTILSRRGRLDEARSVLRESLALYQTLGSQTGIASVYARLGSVALKENELVRAGDLYRKALEIEEQFGHVEGMAATVGNLSILYKRLNNLERAEEMARRAVDLNQTIGRQSGLARAYGNLAIVLLERKEYVAAEEMFRQSLAIFEALHDLEGMATGYQNLAEVRCVLGDGVVAKDLYLKAAEIWETLEVTGAAAEARAAALKECPSSAAVNGSVKE